ncbi:APC membrane recruitment protein 3 [Gastrophryne carolinensis]
MELIRGKTFIINYAQNPPEKLPQVGGKEKKKVDVQKNRNECETKKNVTKTQRMSHGVCTKAPVDNVRYPKPVKKSKTYECVTRDDKLEKNTGVSGNGRIPSSSSSPSLIEDPGGKRNDPQITTSTACKQSMIDYRNFVPQMPFVPSVAKSLPRKRITLRRSKKTLKNIFNLKRNKQQETISEDERLQTVNYETAGGKIAQRQSQSNIGNVFYDDLLTSEFPDREICIDSFKALCEDVASLKSFDSLTGCGEIFADECSSFIDVENCRVTFISKPNPIAANLEGGGEKLASPAKSESIDFSKLRGHIKSLPSNLQSANGPFGAKSPPEPNENNDCIPRDHMSISSCNDLMSCSENISNPESPRSTSDEGYYDSYSPGLDEEKNEPETPSSFPRDSYSGDALYELFCEETKSPDCELPDSGSNEGNPSSIYSFCVGSEENMASQPPFEQAGDGALQNTWKGRECLLKLCDTELTLSMGMVNWLKKTGKITDCEINDHTLICDQHETIGQLSRENDSNALGVFFSKKKGKPYQTQGNYKENEYCNIIRRIKDSEDLLADILSVDPTQELDTSSLKPIENLQDKSYPPDNLLHVNDSRTESSVLSDITSDMKNHCDFESTTHSLSPLESKTEQNATNVASPCSDTLSSFGLQHLTGSLSEDKSLMEILDKFSARLSSLHITLGSKNALHGTNKIMRPYEIAQNIKNLIEHQDSGSQSAMTKHALLSESHNKTDKQDLKTMDEPILLNTLSMQYLNEDCSTDSQEPKETQSHKTVRKANFLPLFKSPCSSVISRFSSALFRVHNSGDAVIFFNTGRYNQSSVCDDGFLNDSGTLSVEFSKLTKNSFDSARPMPDAGEKVIGHNNNVVHTSDTYYMQRTTFSTFSLNFTMVDLVHLGFDQSMSNGVSQVMSLFQAYCTLLWVNG